MEVFDVLLVLALLLFLGVGVYLECLLQLSCCRSPRWALDSPWSQRTDCSFLVPLLLSESTFAKLPSFTKSSFRCLSSSRRTHLILVSLRTTSGQQHSGCYWPTVCFYYWSIFSCPTSFERFSELWGSLSPQRWTFFLSFLFSSSRAVELLHGDGSLTQRLGDEDNRWVHHFDGSALLLPGVPPLTLDYVHCIIYYVHCKTVSSAAHPSSICCSWQLRLLLCFSIKNTSGSPFCSFKILKNILLDIWCCMHGVTCNHSNVTKCNL